MKIIKSRAKTCCGGMTLIEIMVAVGISSIVLVVVATFSFYSLHSFAAIANYVDLDNTSRKAVDVMTKEIRQTKALSNYATSALTFTDYDDKQLQYLWNPTRRELTRVKDANSTVLLTECDSLEFHIYQRTPQPGTNSFYPATDPAQCKLVDMKWRCSRSLLGKKANTETVQTAQVVIRN
jgi:prepilin-type N-terminal cleavage/methylation domain-containing protein